MYDPVNEVFGIPELRLHILKFLEYDRFKERLFEETEELILENWKFYCSCKWCILDARTSLGVQISDVYILENIPADV